MARIKMVQLTEDPSSDRARPHCLKGWSSWQKETTSWETKRGAETCVQCPDGLFRSASNDG
jgi:hypothetical protein